MATQVHRVQTEAKAQDQYLKYVTILTKVGQYIASIVLAATDYSVIVIALLSVWYLRSTVLPQIFPALLPFDINSTYVYCVIPLFYLSILTYEGMYTRCLPFWQSAKELFKVCAIVSTVVIVTMYFLKVGHVSRLFIILSWLICFICLVISRYSVKRILAVFGLWQRPVVIIGAGKTAELLAKTFEEEPNIGYRIAGLIEDQHHERPLTRRYPYMGSFSNAEQAIKESGLKDVIIATPGLSREELIPLINRIQPYVKNLVIVPNLFGIPLGNLKVETLLNAQAVMLGVQNNLASLSNRLVKRIFDLVLGAIIFIAIFPVLCILTILIKLNSSGPVLHIASRLGKDGKQFLCYKFRTMYVNGDDMLGQYLADHPEAKYEWETYAKLREYDPRVTGVGIWMRKLSLDELPQIINVLKGEMSLVGPRPYLLREKEKMGYYFGTIIDTVPGITGLWQVSGRNNIDFEGRLQMDVWYVRNWSLWMDIMLLIKTIKVVLLKNGAY